MGGQVQQSGRLRSGATECGSQAAAGRRAGRRLVQTGRPRRNAPRGREPGHLPAAQSPPQGPPRPRRAARPPASADGLQGARKGATVGRRQRRGSGGSSSAPVGLGGIKVSSQPLIDLLLMLSEQHLQAAGEHSGERASSDAQAHPSLDPPSLTAPASAPEAVLASSRPRHRASRPLAPTILPRSSDSCRAIPRRAEGQQGGDRRASECWQGRLRLWGIRWLPPRGRPVGRMRWGSMRLFARISVPGTLQCLRDRVRG